MSISRRRAIGTGLLAGASAVVLPDWAGAAHASSLAVIKKKIPSTGELLPVLGIGTNAFHTNRNKYEQLRDVLKRLHELGGQVIDTAAAYGDSEEVIGKALAELNIRSRMFIATKLNAAGAMPGPPPVGAGPPPGGPQPDTITDDVSFERSLMRLQTDHIDLLQAHFLSSLDPLMPLLQELKRRRKIRYIGVTTISGLEHAQLIEAMRKHPIDFIQVDYSLGNREAAQTVFPVARERKIAVMVAVPLGGHFGSLMKQINNRQLPSWAADIDVTSWSQFFLKYVVSHPDVTCVIPGSTQIEHLEDDQMAGRGRLPNAATRKCMEEFWDHGA